MALKVWLPLTGTLENKGISDPAIGLVGSPTIKTAGKIGKCYTLNGSNGFSIAQQILPSKTPAWSFACWFSLANITSTAAACLFSERTGGNANGYTIFIYPNNSNMLIDDGTRWQVKPITFAANTWYHLAVTRDSTGKKIYINGELKSSTTTIGNTSAINANGCLIGLAQSSAALTTGSQGLIGDINDVRIYDHCLSPLEVKEISQGLILHYKLDGFSGDKIIDSSGHNYNFNIIGNPTIVEDSGRYSKALYTPSGSYLINPVSCRECMPTDALTLNAWIKPTTWATPMSCTEGGGFNFESSPIRFPVYVSGVGYKIATSTTTGSSLAGSWHMLTGTFDRTNVKIYIDGELQGTTPTDSTNIISYANNGFVIGGEANGTTTSAASSSYVGNISDVRIYATALSAEDIATLYHTPAQIDNLGGIHGFEFVEEGEKDSVYQNGIISTGQSKNYLVNNFSETNTMTGWSFGGSPTISNGVVTMTGVNPAFSSDNFTVNPDDIVVVEFDIEMPVVSTTTSNPGVCIGTPTGSANSTTQYSYNFSTKKWTTGDTNNTNPYFMCSYNSTDHYHCRTYLLGSNKTIDDLPYAEASNTRTLCALKLNSATTAKIRSGYNSNTTMTIKLSNFKVYRLDNEGFCETSDIARIGTGYYQSTNFIEK